MNAATYRRPAAATAVACGLLALAACTSSSSDDHKADDKAPHTDGRSTLVLSVGTGATGTGSLLSPLVLPAPRDLAAAADGLGVHTVRVEQSRWTGSLRDETITGVVDWTGGPREELVIDISGGAAADAADDGESLSKVRVRVVDGAGYLYAGKDHAKDAEGRHWVKETEDAEGSVANFANFSPVKQRDSVLSLPTVEEVGEGTFRGVRATHYRSVLSAASVAALPESVMSADQKESLDQALESAGIASETVDMWLTKDRLPLELTVLDDSERQGESKSVTDYSDYGLAMNVQAPPAFDTIGSDELDD